MKIRRDNKRQPSLRRNLRKFKLERLEGRSLLAGDVTITTAGNEIQITGDGDDNDIVITADPSIPGRFSIDTGADSTDINGGPGPLEFEGRSLRINMLGGNDTVTIIGDGGAGSELSLNLTADLGNGDNIFSFTGGYEVHGGLRVMAGAGADTVTIDDVRARDMFFSTGSGGEAISITNSSTTSSLGNLSVTATNAAGGSHDLTLSNVQIRKDLAVTLGPGDANVTIDDTQVTGVMTVRTGTGLASVQIGTTTEVTAGDLYILTGLGDADIDVIGGSFRLMTIKTLTGAADENLVGFETSKSLLITNGATGDVINIDAVTIGQSISIYNSAGDHDISIDSGDIAGSVGITTLGGTQNFDFGANGLVTTGGSFSVKNGIAGVVTFNAINLDIGKAFALVTGRGMHNITIGTADAAVSVGQVLAVRSDGGASMTMDNTTVGLDLSISLGNTNTGYDMLIGTNSLVTVARNASFLTGTGNANITLGALDVGGNLIVQSKLGGSNVYTIGGISGIGDLFVGGQTIIDSGSGDDVIDIGSDAGAATTFTGFFNLNAGKGDDDVTIGEGTGGDAFSFGNFTIDGSFGHNTLTVTNGTAFDPIDPAFRRKIRNFSTINT